MVLAILMGWTLQRLLVDAWQSCGLRLLRICCTRDTTVSGLLVEQMRVMCRMCVVIEIVAAVHAATRHLLQTGGI